MPMSPKAAFPIHDHAKITFPSSLQPPVTSAAYIDFSMYTRPPSNNEYAVVHDLPDGRQRVVANVSGHMVVLISGHHFSTATPLPHFIPQNLSLKMSTYTGQATEFIYPTATAQYPFVVLGEKPVVLYFPGLLTDIECDSLRHVSKDSLTRSLVAKAGNGQRGAVVDSRTSQQAWLPDDSSPATKRIHQRLQRLVGLSQSEAFQILKYDHSQQYVPHHDYFDPLVFGNQTDNRAATFVMYLNTVPSTARGDTYFPRAFGRPNKRYRVCESGLSVYPIKGAAVLFFDQIPTGQLDSHSLHGSCAIATPDVTKWVATKWFHSNTSKFGASSSAHAFGP